MASPAPWLPLDPSRQLPSLRADGERIVEVLRTAPASAPVPGCPGWDVTELGSHVLGIYEKVGFVLSTDRSLAEHHEVTGPGGEGLAAAVEASFERLTGLLERRDSDEPTWTWAGPRQVRFWVRRMAAETLVHRADAESALGERTAIAPEAAADALDEYLSWLLPVLGARRVGASVRLSAGDVDAHWAIDAGPGPAVAAEGRAEDLLLVTFNRRPRAALTVDGDVDALDRWLAEPAF